MVQKAQYTVAACNIEFTVHDAVTSDEIELPVAGVASEQHWIFKVHDNGFGVQNQRRQWNNAIRPVRRNSVNTVNTVIRSHTVKATLPLLSVELPLSV